MGWSEHMKGDLGARLMSLYVGMTKPLSLNSWSFKTTENQWASNMAGQQCFETWQVRIWSKCHSGRKSQSRVEPLSIKACCWCSNLHRSYTGGSTLPGNGPINNDISNKLACCFLLHCPICFPSLEWSLLSALQSLLLQFPSPWSWGGCREKQMV